MSKKNGKGNGQAVAEKAEHGPVGPPSRVGVDRLRAMLHLSEDVPVNRVCHEAADEIEKLSGA